MRKLFFLPALLLAAPAAAQQEAATAPHVAEAIAACQAITGTDDVRYDNLPPMEWDNAKRRGARSQRVFKGLYQKEGNNTLIVVANEQLEAKTCVVQAFLPDTASYVPLLQEVSQSIGMPEQQDGYSYFWTIAGHTVRVDPAGDAKRPFARFEISAIPQESAE